MRRCASRGAIPTRNHSDVFLASALRRSFQSRLHAGDGNYHERVLFPTPNAGNRQLLVTLALMREAEKMGEGKE